MLKKTCFAAPCLSLLLEATAQAAVVEFTNRPDWVAATSSLATIDLLSLYNPPSGQLVGLSNFSIVTAGNQVDFSNPTGLFWVHKPDYNWNTPRGNPLRSIACGNCGMPHTPPGARSGSCEDLDVEDAEPIRLPVTDVFDLHSVPPADVKEVVEEYLKEAHRLGYRALRLIHGRGIGVQREIVRGVLARTPSVADFRDAPAEAGGWGATIVTLRD